MFMGHYGPAIWDTQRGKSEPLIKLWQAFLAVQLVDIVFCLLAIAGLEGGGVMVDGAPIFNIPYSHSLIGSIILSAIGGGLFWAFNRDKGAKGFWVFAALVFSHWVMDLIVHRPDLPPYPGSDIMWGLALWNYPWLAFVLEIGLLFLAFLFWQSVTTAKFRGYTIAIWVLFVVMVLLQIGGILIPGLQVQDGTFDLSTAPDGAVLGVSGLIVFIGLAGAIAWIEKGRSSKLSAAKTS